MVAILGSAGGGKFTPDKPVITHHTTKGQFIITNYDPSYTYTITVNTGTVTRSTDILTLSNENSIATVFCTSPRGIASSNATAERKKYTATQGAADVSYVHAPPAHGVSIPNVIGGRWLYCAEFPWPECGHQEGPMIKASTPSGYTDSYSEWWKCT